MDILLTPDFAYLLLVGGLVCAVLALLSPGTGVLEVLGLFTLVLAGWRIYNLPFNIWSLAILLVGGALFVFSTRKTSQWPWLIVSILCLVIGSVFMFRGETGWQPAVNPFLATVVSVLSAGFFWLAARKSMEANLARPAHDLNSLIGMIGEAKTKIYTEGSVQVQGELWSAYSDSPIPVDSQVRVIGREGFLLHVEAIE